MRLQLLFIFLFGFYCLGQSDDIKAGPYVEYYENGNIKLEGTYSDKGVKNGLWKEYYETGKLKCSRNYKRDYLIGEYREFFEDGTLKIEGNYSPFQTKKEGTWKEYFENGNIKSQAQFHSDQLSGIYLEYYINGNLSLKGEYDYFKFTKKGDWIEYYENGAIKKQQFYNSKGVLENLSKSYYPNGKLKELGEHEYLTGQKDGKWIRFYEEGDTMAVSYFRLGKQVGAHYEFHADGKTKIVCEYDFSGKLNGLYHEVDLNGETLTKGSYLEGERTGKWMIRNELGELKKVKY
jgi:antitoxin component YwqK of YwqJK toxin-antitoxin module